MSKSILQISQSDVTRIVDRDFSIPDCIPAHTLLEEYGAEDWQREKLRVQVAMLKLANGNLAKLKAVVELAKTDFRDVLVPAEFPSTNRVSLVSLSKSTPKQRSDIEAEDRLQYKKWFEA